MHLKVRGQCRLVLKHEFSFLDRRMVSIIHRVIEKGKK